MFCSSLFVCLFSLLILEHCHSKQVPLSGLLGRYWLLAQAREESSKKHLWNNKVLGQIGVFRV